METNYENVAEIGQTIKGFDFEPSSVRKDIYMQGKVIDKGWITHPETGHQLFKGYTIEVEIDGGSDDNARVGEIGYIPFAYICDYEGRVELIDPEFEEKHGRTLSEVKDLVKHFKKNKKRLVNLVDHLLDDADAYMESALLYDVEHCNKGRERLALAQYIVVNYLSEK